MGALLSHKPSASLDRSFRRTQILKREQEEEEEQHKKTAHRREGVVNSTVVSHCWQLYNF